MNILNELSSALNRKDQKPNIQLGGAIARQKNISAIQDMMVLLESESRIEIIGDLIKVFESIGDTDPTLIKNAFPILIKFIHHPQKQIVWRAMCVLAQISKFHRKETYKDLGSILTVMDEGGVITRDHGVDILLDLYQDSMYKTEITPLLEEQLLRAPDNQFGQYAEKWLQVISENDMPVLAHLLEQRIPELEKESHQKRSTKLLVRLRKKAV